MSIQSSPVVHALPYPVLEAGNLSFPEGNYELNVKMGQDGCSVEIEHIISGAPFIEKLLSEDLVEYYCLLSVPKSGVRKLFKTGKKGKIDWDSSIIGEPPKLRPILIYTGEELEHKFSKKCGVAELWQGITINVPKGARLARGSFLNVNSSEFRLIRFNKSKEHLSGTFNVEASTEEGFYFSIKAAPDVFSFVQKYGMDDALSSGLLTAVVAQCFSILKEDYPDTVENSIENFPNLEILSDKLREEFGCDWNDEEFDPMLAATKLYPFKIPKVDLEDE